jgi:hypothetical protein
MDALVSGLEVETLRPASCLTEMGEPCYAALVLVNIPGVI